MSSSIFNEALRNFSINFAYGDAIRHLYRKGYTTDRIMRDFDYPLSKEELEKIKENLEKENKRHQR